MLYDYPDPLEVGVEVLSREGRYTWGLVTAGNLTLSGALPADATRVDAQMAVLTALLEHPQLVGLPLNLFCADQRLHTALTDLRQLVPHVEPHPYSDRLSGHPRVRAARALAHAAFEQLTGPVRVVAATDGSFGRHGRLAGWGYVTNTGAYRLGHLGAHDVVVAELAAIRAVLADTDPGVDLTVLSDSQPALDLVAQAQSAARTGTPLVRPTGVRRVDAQVSAISRLLVDREVTFAWVRAHAGHPLNEGADRLAVHARRAVSAEVDVETLEQVAANIAAETVAAAATHPDLLAATQPVRVAA